MRAARDTFLIFLNDNITGGIPIHAVRRSSTDPNADQLQIGAVNVKFLDPEFNNKVAVQPVAIDIVHDDELTALDWANAVWNLLSIRMYTELKDYTNPASPVNTGYTIYWPDTLRFRQVESPFYAHFHLRIPLYHHIP
jgi:hypothetical protein